MNTDDKRMMMDIITLSGQFEWLGLFSFFNATAKHSPGSLKCSTNVGVNE